VISGFPITGLLIREVETHGRLSLRRFYARRAKRLLPAAGLVLAATAALTWLTISLGDWAAFGWDIVGAALYVVNWVLAGRAVDYLAEDVGASPVQHFWSLAVEEQFYIVWPLLLVLVGWVVRRRGLPVRPVMAVAIGAAQWRRLPARFAALLGWGGLAAIVLSGLVTSAETTWPGTAALLPTLGTAAVVVAGFSAGAGAPAGLLSLRPAVWVGGLSYSL